MVASVNDLHPALITAVIRHSELAADITAECLSRLRARMIDEGLLAEDSPLRLPGAFLMELGAIGQLSLWEHQGLRDLLPPEIPTVAEATAELYRRASAVPEEFQLLSGATLAPRVRQVYLEHICWAAPEMLTANIVVGETDEDALVEAVARLLWHNRANLFEESC